MQFYNQRVHIVRWYSGIVFLNSLLSFVTFELLHKDDENNSVVWMYFISYCLITFTVTHLYLCHLFMLLSIKLRFFKFNEFLRFVKQVRGRFRCLFVQKNEIRCCSVTNYFYKPRRFNLFLTIIPCSTFTTDYTPANVTIIRNNSQTDAFVVRRLSMLHEKLNDAMDLVNRCFSIQVRIHRKRKKENKLN